MERREEGKEDSVPVKIWFQRWHYYVCSHTDQGQPDGDEPILVLSNKTQFLLPLAARNLSTIPPQP